MSDNIRGLLVALMAAGLFAIVAALSKIAVKDYHVLQILFIRQMIIMVSVTPTFARSGVQTLIIRRPLLHILRIIGAFTALSTSIWAVAVLPLATVITLFFSQVFFVVILAKLFLKERVGAVRIAAVLVGFLGVIVVFRPGLEGFVSIYGLIPVLGALGAALAISCVRSLTATESTATLLSYQAIFVGLAAAMPLFWFWKTPDMAGLLLLVGMGIISTIAQWLGVMALRLAEVSVVGPVEYVKLLYAIVLGYILFSEVPDAYTLLGAGIIISSSLFILYREIRLSKR